MPRYDKYDPTSGGHRAALVAAVAAADKNTLYGVGLDSAGRAVIGSGQTGIIGVFVAHKPLKAGDIADIMTDGEILEMTGLAAGTVYFAGSDGAISTTNTGTRIGYTAEATRLIVRVAR